MHLWLGQNSSMALEAVELVWFEAGAAQVAMFALAQPQTLLSLQRNLPIDLQTKFADLAPSRYGITLAQAAVVSPGDQIAWLEPLKVDPQSARAARVEKQRKERRREKSIPKKLR
jgi:putative ubiquitin-RnfH superfamily antitoxin RatB of RatAB toxin-antitoxin module